MDRKPRLLDLFCGAGGAAMGYDTERAWAAGFFDGEGCTSVIRDKRPGRKPGVSLSIEQVDARPLERFKAAVGYHGNIVDRPARGISKASHRIYMTGMAAQRAMQAMWPYLSEPKREQYRRALVAIGETHAA